MTLVAVTLKFLLHHPNPSARRKRRKHSPRMHLQTTRTMPALLWRCRCTFTSKPLLRLLYKSVATPTDFRRPM
jgi:hypothetical protein